MIIHHEGVRRIFNENKVKGIVWLRVDPMLGAEVWTNLSLLLLVSIRH